jgi:hypothetical protein
MNKILSTTLTVIAILVLAGTIFLAGSMYAGANVFGYGWGNNNAYGPSMLNGRGPNMMNSSGYISADFTPLTIDQTKVAAETYLANLNDPDLEIAEIMIFDNNGYAVVKEASTGIGALELLVDSVSQTVFPEHGPNMMWNLKYSRLNHANMSEGFGGMVGGGMMNGWDNTTPLDITTDMTVTPEQAVEYAQKYLDANISGATAHQPMQFYGYYTLDFEKDGKVVGMLSINGYSGQVFLHTWHGTFIEEIEYE